MLNLVVRIFPKTQEGRDLHSLRSKVNDALGVKWKTEIL